MQNHILRHFLATLKYRCTKAIKDAPANFPNYNVGSGVRTPLEILSHMSQVLRFAQSVFDDFITIDMEIGSWDVEVNRFYSELEYLDSLISKGLPQRDRIVEMLLQGPLSDAMTHVGQLSMIRRMSGTPIPGESFFDADIPVE
jgi:hypothetical protein